MNKINFEYFNPVVVNLSPGLLTAAAINIDDFTIRKQRSYTNFGTYWVLMHKAEAKRLKLNYVLHMHERNKEGLVRVDVPVCSVLTWAEGFTLFKVHKITYT